MGNWIDKKEWLNNNEDEDRKKDSKVIVADFDPRSPSNGIVRTPIIYVGSSEKDKGSKQQNQFYNVNDPRSPSEKYNRTPINVKKEENYDALEESSNSDSSFLLQQVPDDQQQSPDRYTISTKPLHITSNLPRHIIQRKQIEKINKKKFQNLDKENCDE